MDLPQFALLTILSIVLSGVREAASWRSNEDRSDGYDLQRGPVFYEAYYADNEGPPAPGQQLMPVNANAQRRYSDRANVLQKTRQSPDASYGTPYDSDSRQPGNSRGFAGPYDWSSQPGVASESFLLETPKESNEPIDRNIANVEAEKVARQLKKLVESIRHEASSINFSDRNSRLDNEPTNFRRPYSRRNYEENAKSYPEERLDESINVILSAVRNGALKISEEVPVDLRRDKEESVRVGSDDLVRRYRSSVVPDVSGLEESRSAVLGGSFGRASDDRFERTSGDEFSDVRGPASGMALGRMENIFQPRPQVISYVFSPVRAPAKAAPAFAATGEIPQTRSISSNGRPTGNDGDNIIDSGVGKDVGRSDGTSAGVASIEVSEMPRHKIRHHHGEKPRREHQRRQAAARN